MSSLQGEEKGEKRTFMKTCEMPTCKGCTEEMELTQASERKRPGTQGQKKKKRAHGIKKCKNRNHFMKV